MNWMWTAVMTAGAWTGASETDALVVLNKFEARSPCFRRSRARSSRRSPWARGRTRPRSRPTARPSWSANYGGRKPGNTLSVLDMRSLEVVKVVELEGYHRPHGIEFLDDATRVVVTAETEKSLLVVNLESGEVEAAIPTEQEASHMVVLDKDTKRAFVANIVSGSITVLDLEQKKFLKKLPTGAGAEGIDKHPTRKEVWVTNRSRTRSASWTPRRSRSWRTSSAPSSRSA